MLSLGSYADPFEEFEVDGRHYCGVFVGSMSYHTAVSTCRDQYNAKLPLPKSELEVVKFNNTYPFTFWLDLAVEEGGDYKDISAWKDSEGNHPSFLHNLEAYVTSYNNYNADVAASVGGSRGLGRWTHERSD